MPAPALGVYTSNGGYSTAIATSTGITTQATGSSFAAWICSDGTISAFSDTYGNTWTQKLTNGNAPNFQRYANLWVCENGVGGAGHKINATQTGNAFAVAFIEVLNATALDQYAQTNNDSYTNTVNFPSVTTTQSSEVLLEFAAWTGTPGTISGLTAGFTQIVLQGDGASEESVFVAYQVLSSTGTFAPSLTKSGNQPYFVAATSFYGGSAPPPSTQQQFMTMGVGS